MAPDYQWDPAANTASEIVDEAYEDLTGEPEDESLAKGLAGQVPIGPTEIPGAGTTPASEVPQSLLSDAPGHAE